MTAALAGLVVWTIGHSTRSLAEFVALLESHGIECLADVRRHPGSRAYPHFNADALARSLPDAHIDYHPFIDLGGRRPTSSASRNGVWRNASFRGYADFMETDAFQTAYSRLYQQACRRRTALMCSEAVWWRCHRALISDALKADGATVLHIMDASKVVEHPYTAPARVENGALRYHDGPEPTV